MDAGFVFQQKFDELRREGSSFFWIEFAMSEAAGAKETLK
jgi:hypothetical protein